MSAREASPGYTARPHEAFRTETISMYDMYPEWAAAAHDDRPAHHPEHQTASTPWSTPVQESLDLRDHGGERPDQSRNGRTIRS